MLGAFLREEPPYEAGRAKTFTVTTRAGRPITADIITSMPDTPG